MLAGISARTGRPSERTRLDAGRRRRVGKALHPPPAPPCWHAPPKARPRGPSPRGHRPKVTTGNVTHARAGGDQSTPPWHARPAGSRHPAPHSVIVTQEHQEPPPRHGAEGPPRLALARLGPPAMRTPGVTLPATGVTGLTRRCLQSPTVGREACNPRRAADGGCNGWTSVTIATAIVRRTRSRQSARGSARGPAARRRDPRRWPKPSHVKRAAIMSGRSGQCGSGPVIPVPAIPGPAIPVPRSQSRQAQSRQAQSRLSQSPRFQSHESRPAVPGPATWRS